MYCIVLVYAGVVLNLVETFRLYGVVHCCVVLIIVENCIWYGVFPGGVVQTL